jgi:hypothetical protein
MHPSASPPRSSAVVTSSCCWKAYRYKETQITRGAPKQNPSCARPAKREPNTNDAILIAASVVAAIRLRGQEIKPSPKLNAMIQDSSLLVRMILSEIERG